MLVRIAVMITLLLPGVVLASPLPPADPVAEAAAIRWLGGAAHPFTSESPSDDELQPIVDALAGARIIGIGEATHGAHEDQAFKAELIKALVRSHKVEVLVLELNRQVGVDLDAYVLGRGGDIPLLVRSPSFFRVWRNDEFTGLLLWLRAFNLQTDHPVRVLSVDVQDAGVDADLALRFVAGRDPAAANQLRPAFQGLLPGPGSQRFSVWQAKVDKAVYARAVQAAQDLNALLAKHSADWSGNPEFAEAVYAAQTARQGLAMFALDGGRGDLDKAGPAYFGKRDQFMAANMLQRLEGRTAVFWAHDSHVIADMPTTGSFPVGSTWVGRELRHALGGRYQNVTFAWSHGSFRAQTMTGSGAEANTASVLHRTKLVPQDLRNDRAGELGAVLSQVGPDRFWVDLRAAPDTGWARIFLSTFYYRGWEGWGVDPGKWQQDPDDKAPLRPGSDILVWFRRITPSHLLPGDDY
jgi:erythromycin esterase